MIKCQKKILIVLAESVFKIDKTYYPQVFLEKFKYIAKEKELIRHIID